MPVFQILDVARNAVLDVGVIPCFTAEPAHLGEAGRVYVERFEQRRVLEKFVGELACFAGRLDGTEAVPPF